MIARYAYLKRAAPPRWRRGTARRGPMRSARYRAYLHDKPCACGCGRTPCDPAHTENNGMSSKGRDSSCVPLYRDCHRAYDAGRREFELRHQVNMGEVATYWYARFQRETERLAV